MDKDEILERSRKENKDLDLVELEALNKASGTAYSVGLLVCCLLAAITAICQGRVDYSALTLMASIRSTVMLVKFAKLRRWHELVIGLFYLFVAIFFFAWYLWDALGVL